MSDVNAIFDAAGKVFCALIKDDKIREKNDQIRSVTERRCGNCDHWMTSTCRPEKDRKQLKSMNSSACKDFERSYASKRLEAQFRDELQSIQEEGKDGGE